MLAFRIHAKEDLRIEPFAVPEAGPGEVLLRLGAAGICGWLWPPHERYRVARGNPIRMSPGVAVFRGRAWRRSGRYPWPRRILAASDDIGRN